MKLSKHKNHRNPAYLDWLRKQPCVASGNKAQCAHHIRLGTNGGSSLKPSDYFCIPLRNEFHTTGLFAIHVVGEETFFKEFKLDPRKIFVKYLKQYLIEKFDVHVQLKDPNQEDLIAYMIKLIEEKGPKFDRPKKKKKAKQADQVLPKVSITESEFYQKAKEAKKIQDKKLRIVLESRKKESNNQKVKVDVTKSDFYQQAKELKRQRDKELRAKLKQAQKKEKPKKNAPSEFELKAKELKRQRDKEFRDKLKAQRKNLT